MSSLPPPPASIVEEQPIIFTKDDFQHAPLTCSATIECERIAFGFTSGANFFCDNVIPVTSTVFNHVQTVLQLSTDFPSGQTLKTEIPYTSFNKLNFKLTKHHDDFLISLITVINHAPLFFLSEDETESNYLSYRRYNPKNGKSPWNRLVNANAFHIYFKLATTDMQSFLGQLYSLSCLITYNNEKICKYDIPALKMKELQQEMIQWPWEVYYRIEAIKSIGTIGIYFLDYQLFQQKKIDFIRENVQHNHQMVVTLLTSIYEHLRNDLSLASMDIKDDHIAIERKLRDEYVWIKTIYVTPTQTLLTLNEATMDCRGFRKLGIQNLIQVKYRDETLKYFPRELAEEIILPVCRNGITIGKRHFHEFGQSSSLFREYGTYFYATDDKKEIVKLWQSLGNFKRETAAKVGSRIGLYFTSARQSIKLSQDYVLLTEDFMTSTLDSGGNPYCFSDGCGIISPVFAKMIAEHLGILYIPSAFQIRYAGYKGMVSVDIHDDRLLGNGGRYYACLRQSQKKFDVFDKSPLDFDISQWSGPGDANFHHCFIATLDALALQESSRKQKEFNQRLLHLLNESFTDILKPLVDGKGFVKTFAKLPKYFPLSKMNTHEEVLMYEPFLRSMIEAKAALDANMLANKSQIPIPHELGRMALGIVDTTGILEEGQIFFQFSNSLNRKGIYASKTIKVGPIGVTKSPIYHAGDIRFLTAVDVPQLHHLVDVLVFPKKGSRPHTDEIGGGDLDGDTYLIFWDPAFLLSRNVPATDFTPPSADHIAKVSLEELQEEHPLFRVHYLKEDGLAYLSTCHLSHLTTLSILHPECENLAKNTDVAVNFFKSGIAPKPLGMDEKSSAWPKFMGKRHQSSFSDNHILCELNDHASTFYHLIQIAQQEALKHRQNPPAILLDVNEGAKKLFESYKYEIHSLMKRYQIKSEGELFSATYLEIAGVLRNNRKHDTNYDSTSCAIQSTVFEIFKRYRTVVLDMFSNTWHDEMKMKLKPEDIFNFKLTDVPQEMVDLAKTFYALAEQDGTCYSFPWIAWEGLDLWLSTNYTRTTKININNLLEIESTDYLSAQEHLHNVPPNIQEMITDFRRFPWFQEFANILLCWFHAESFDTRLLCHTLSSFMRDFLQNAEERSLNLIMLRSLRGGTVFLHFLGMILVSGCNLFQLQEDDKKKLYMAAQSTLIKLAFTPDSDKFFTIKLQDQVITYPCFVVSVPSIWSDEFLEKYKKLEEVSGCTEVVVGLRKTFAQSHLFTIMCRGRLESCQKLEKILTPVMHGYINSTMKLMKMDKIQKMNDLLQEVFSFPPLSSNYSKRSGGEITTNVRIIYPRVNYSIAASSLSIRNDKDFKSMNQHNLLHQPTQLFKDVLEKDEPMKKYQIVPRSKSSYYVAYLDKVSGRYKHAGKAQQSKEQGHRIKLALVVDRNSLPFLYQGPFIIPEIQALTQNLTSQADFNVPFIGFFDNSSVICIRGENGYRFLNEWDGLYGKDLYLSFEQKEPSFVADVLKIKDKDPFVVYDLIKILSMPADGLKIDPKWGFKVITNDPENPVLLSFETFSGRRMAATPVFLIALLLNHHLNAIMEEVGKKPTKLAFRLFTDFSDDEKNRIQKGVHEACKLLKICFVIIDHF